MDVDVQESTSQTLQQQPLLLDLSHSAQLFLERIGFLPTTQSPNKSLIRQDVNSYSTLLGLIPLSDLQLLLSILPSPAIPTNLPFTVQPAKLTPTVRRAILSTLCRLSLSPPITIEILSVYRPLATAIVGNWFELLGLDDQGNWRSGQQGVEQAQGEGDAVEKVWFALTKALPLLREEALPYVLSLSYSPFLFPSRMSADLESVIGFFLFQFLAFTLPSPFTSKRTSPPSF